MKKPRTKQGTKLPTADSPLNDIYLTLCGNAIRELKKAGISPLVMAGGSKGATFLTTSQGETTALIRIELRPKLPEG